jgi:hypothetical protein
LCPAAERLFAAAPCPALNAEGKCGLVISEESAGLEVLRRLLGIGMGCSMPDDDTSDAAIQLFDARCLARLRRRDALCPACQVALLTHHGDACPLRGKPDADKFDVRFAPGGGGAAAKYAL